MDKLTLASTIKWFDRGMIGPYSRRRFRPGNCRHKGRLIPCQAGFHCVTVMQAIQWIRAEVSVVDILGNQIEHQDKIITDHLTIHPILETWTLVAMIGFATDCVEHITTNGAIPDHPNGFDIRALLGDVRNAATNFEWDECSKYVRGLIDIADGLRARRPDGTWDYDAYHDERRWQANRLLDYLNGEA